MRITLLIFALLFLIDTNGQSYLNSSGDSVSIRAYANVGLFFPTLTTSLRVDSKRGPGTELGLEDDFDFDETLSVFYAQAIVRVKRRSQFLLSFTNMSRNSSFTLDRDITFADTTFYLGASLNLKFDVNYYAFTWRYSFFDQPNWNAGMSLGLRAAQFIVNADATLNQFEYSESARVTAPAPLIGIHGSGYLTDRFLARYSLEYFTVSIEGIDINVLETRASLEYFIFENVGVGAAYSTSEYRISELPLSDDFQGRILFDFSGANLFLSARL